MNSQLLTGLVAALGLMANFALVGETRAQDGHGEHAGGGHGHHHADFESGRFHMRVDGEAGPGVKDIILIPGHSSSPHAWEGTIDHLLAEGGWRVHTVHVQGFAGAPVMDNVEGPVAAPVAEDIARYIAEQRLERPAVVGHSMGGTIGMMLAARHPQAVGKLMVVDMVPFMGAMFGQPGTNPTAESVAPIAQQMTAGMASSPREAYVAQATASINGMINTVSMRETALADMRATDQQVAARAFGELIATDLRPELANITVPVEVLYVPFNYPGMTPEMTDGIYRMSFSTLPGADLTRIDDSAHFIMWDQPDRFYAELDAFLAD